MTKVIQTAYVQSNIFYEVITHKNKNLNLSNVLRRSI